MEPIMVDYPWYDHDIMGGLDYCTVATIAVNRETSFETLQTSISIMDMYNNPHHSFYSLALNILVRPPSQTEFPVTFHGVDIDIFCNCKMYCYSEPL